VPELDIKSKRYCWWLRQAGVLLILFGLIPFIPDGWTRQGERSLSGVNEAAKPTRPSVPENVQIFDISEEISRFSSIFTEFIAANWHRQFSFAKNGIDSEGVLVGDPVNWRATWLVRGELAVNLFHNGGGDAKVLYLDNHGSSIKSDKARSRTWLGKEIGAFNDRNMLCCPSSGTGQTDCKYPKNGSENSDQRGANGNYFISENVDGATNCEQSKRERALKVAQFSSEASRACC
jgi:hypothetical protein